MAYLEGTHDDLARIAYQGAPGAFSEDAILELAGDRPERVPLAAFEEVFDAVESERVDAAVVPIENTLSGSVHACYDLMASREVSIAAETALRIAHALIAAPGVTLAHVRRILSHPVALAQCEEFFRRHGKLDPCPTYDTAGAVRQVVEERLADVAAIASRRAAETYGGVVLLSGIEDHPQNYTRFLLIRRGRAAVPAPSAKGPLKAALFFSLDHKPAALFEALRPFATRGIDLTKIESRPLRGSPFEYVFYLDAVAQAPQDLAEAIAELDRGCRRLRSLGYYAPGTRKLTIG